MAELRGGTTIGGYKALHMGNLQLADVRYLKLTGGTVTGTTTFSTPAGADTVVNIYSPDATKNAVLNIYGNGQGTGRLFVGQSMTHGGGIEYNGDDNPITTGAGMDFVTLYRVNAGVYDWTARNAYSSNDWEFRGAIQATSVKIGATTIIEGDAKIAWDKLKNVPSSFSPAAHTHAWSEITSKPTTLSGYGITDAATSSHNHDSTYLKLTGGILTGSVRISVDNNYFGLDTGAVRMGLVKKVGYGPVVAVGLGKSFELHEMSTDYIDTDISGASMTQLLVASGASFKYKTNDIWHAGNFTPSSKADTAHTHTFASLTSKPTTLSGYGITDAAASSHNHDSAYLKLTGGTVTGVVNFNAAPVIQGSVAITNPNNVSATGSLNWDNDDFRIRIGGSGVGSNALFKVQGYSDFLRMSLNSGGDMILAGTSQATAYKIGATTVIESDAKIAWDKLKNVPASFSPAAHTHAWSEITSKPTTLSGYGITDAAASSHNHDADYLKLTGGTVTGSTHLDNPYQAAHGKPRSNLGSPTITEVALFDSQFTNKTWFYPPDKITFEYTNDGTNWVAQTVSEEAIKDLVSGKNNSSIFIPNGAVQYRINIENDGGYVFLNALYMYWSANGHVSQVHIQRKSNAVDAVWENVANATNEVSGWPGHLYLPMTPIYFSQNPAQSSFVRIIFTPRWTGQAQYNINLHGMEIWGGYPAGKRTIYDWDRDRNTTFPERVRARNFQDLNGVNVSYEGHNHDADYLKLTGGTVTGTTTFATPAGQDTVVNISAPHNNDNSVLNIYGKGQGTGKLFVGQEIESGGGIEYNGDNFPTTSGGGADHIVLYRTEASISHWTARNSRSDNNWEFRADVKAETLSTVSGGVIIGTDGKMAWEKLKNVPASFSPAAHTHAWSEITSKPTTLSGYGITDAASSTHNHDSTYLKLTGGALSGALAITGDLTVNGYLRDSRITTGNTQMMAASTTEIYVGNPVTPLWLESSVDPIAYVAGTARTVWHSGNFTPSSKADASHTHTFASLTSKPTTLSGYGITDAATSSHTHTFASLTSKPTTLSGYGITDAAASSHTHTFASLTSKPTTLSGYGITDAASSTHNHDATYLKLTGGTVTGATTFAMPNGADTVVNVYSGDDSNEAVLNIYGNNQGTGRLYVGQSMTYGGGIEYSGDNLPASTGAGADYTVLYRVSNGTTHWTARNEVDSNDWEIRGAIQAASVKVGTTTVIESDAKIDWNKIKNAPAAATASSYRKVVAPATDATVITISIPQYDKATDTLIVHMNGLHLYEGSHYTIAANSASITLTGFNAGTGAEFQFMVYKNVNPILL